MNKPTIDQIAWVFEHLVDHLDEGGTFEDMMNRLEIKPESYAIIEAVGAVDVINILDWASQIENIVSTALDADETIEEVGTSVDFTIDDGFLVPKKGDPGPN